MAVRKPETRARALALQLLYAWDVDGRSDGAPEATWGRVLALTRPGPSSRSAPWTSRSPWCSAAPRWTC